MQFFNPWVNWYETSITLALFSDNMLDNTREFLTFSTTASRQSMGKLWNQQSVDILFCIIIMYFIHNIFKVSETCSMNQEVQNNYGMLK